MKIETSVVRKIGWLMVGLFGLFLIWISTRVTKSSAPSAPAKPESRDPGDGLRGARADVPAGLNERFQLDPRRELGQRTNGLGDSRAPHSAGIE